MVAGSASGVHWKQFIADCNATLLPLGGRMWNWVRSPIRNPISPQSPRLPLHKEKLRILTKLRKVERNAKEKLVFLLISETKDLWNTLYLQVKELPHKVKKLRNNEWKAKFTSLFFASLQKGSCLCCCPVLVQYMSSTCPVFVQWITGHVLHIYCTSTAQDSKQIPC